MSMEISMTSPTKKQVDEHLERISSPVADTKPMSVIQAAEALRKHGESCMEPPSKVESVKITYEENGILTIHIEFQKEKA